MEKLFIALLISFFACNSFVTWPEMEVMDDQGEKDEFWPADMVPHPRPPHLPKKDEGELC